MMPQIRYRTNAAALFGLMGSGIFGLIAGLVILLIIVFGFLWFWGLLTNTFSSTFLILAIVIILMGWVMMSVSRQIGGTLMLVSFVILFFGFVGKRAGILSIDPLTVNNVTLFPTLSVTDNLVANSMGIIFIVFVAIMGIIGILAYLKEMR